MKVTVVENTAIAARMVAQSERGDVAALSSRFCGEEYGLNLLKTNVQDQDNNYTRFICISKSPEIYPGADRTSLMMILPHKPGSLYNVLSQILRPGDQPAEAGEPPLPDREFEFMFYFDLSAPSTPRRWSGCSGIWRRRASSSLPGHLQRGDLLICSLNIWSTACWGSIWATASLPPSTSSWGTTPIS